MKYRSEEAAKDPTTLEVRDRKGDQKGGLNGSLKLDPKNPDTNTTPLLLK